MDGRCSWRPAQIVRVSSSSAFTPNIARQGGHRPYIDLLMKLLGRNRRGLPASRRNDNEQLDSSRDTEGDQDRDDGQKRHSHRSPLFDVPRMAAPRYGRISVMPDCVTSVTGETGRSPNYLVSLLGLWVARLGRAQQVGAFGPRRASGAEIHLPSVDDKQARRHALRRRSDPLAAKSGRVMSEPAMREPCLALKIGESHRGRYRRGLPGHCQKALEAIPLVRTIASSDAIRRLGAQVRQTSVFEVRLRA